MMPYQHNACVRLVPSSLFYDSEQSMWGGSLRKYRIQAIRDMPWHGVKAGDFGGTVEKMDNIGGRAWIAPWSNVSGDSSVIGSARYESTNRLVKTVVGGNAVVTGSAYLRYSFVEDNAVVGGVAFLNDCTVSGNSRIHGNSLVESSVVTDDALLCGYCTVRKSVISKDAVIMYSAVVFQEKVDGGLLTSTKLDSNKASMENMGWMVQKYVENSNGGSDDDQTELSHQTPSLALKPYPSLVGPKTRQLFFPTVSSSLN